MTRDKYLWILVMIICIIIWSHCQIEPHNKQKGGGLTYSLAGAATGALTGAGVGAVVGAGVGAIPGAVVGATIGGAGGYMVDETPVVVAEPAKEPVKKTVAEPVVVETEESDEPEVASPPPSTPKAFDTNNCDHPIEYMNKMGYSNAVYPVQLKKLYFDPNFCDRNIGCTKTKAILTKLKDMGLEENDVYYDIKTAYEKPEKECVPPPPPTPTPAPAPPPSVAPPPTLSQEQIDAYENQVLQDAEAPNLDDHWAWCYARANEDVCQEVCGHKKCNWDEKHKSTCSVADLNKHWKDKGFKAQKSTDCPWRYEIPPQDLDESICYFSMECPEGTTNKGISGLLIDPNRDDPFANGNPSDTWSFTHPYLCCGKREEKHSNLYGLSATRGADQEVLGGMLIAESHFHGNPFLPGIPYVPGSWWWKHPYLVKASENPKCVLGAKCPTGFENKGLGGIIINNAHYHNKQPFVGGVPYNIGWSWVHPYVCCKK